MGLLMSAQVYPAADEHSHVRDVARGIKLLSSDAVLIAAHQMVSLIPPGSTLVPIPGADGKANNSLLLASAIAQIGGMDVADILEGSPRDSQYTCKKLGRGLTAEQMPMMLRAGLSIPDGVVLIDNAAGTGETIRSARMALGGDFPAVVYAAEKKLLEGSPAKRRVFDFDSDFSM